MGQNEVVGTAQLTCMHISIQMHTESGEREAAQYEAQLTDLWPRLRPSPWAQGEGR